MIRLGPSLEKFEEDLSLAVQNEYLQRQIVAGGGTAQVIKRYMRVTFVLFLRFWRRFVPCLFCLSI